MTQEKAIDTKLIGFGAVALLLGASFITASVAYAHGPFGGEDEETREAMHEALLTGDYDAFVARMEESDHPRAANITEDRFDKMSERIAEREAHREAVHEAIEGDDYDTWSRLSEDRRIAEYIDTENWDTFRELHEAHKDGDTERAEELRDELGLPERGEGKGQGKGFRGGNMHRGAGSGDGLNNRWGN